MGQLRENHTNFLFPSHVSVRNGCNRKSFEMGQKSLLGERDKSEVHGKKKTQHNHRNTELKFKLYLSVSLGPKRLFA